MGSKAVGIMTAIVVVAGITTLTLPGRQTPQVLRAMMDAFSGSLRSAIGN